MTIKYFKEHFNLDRPHEVDSSIKPMSSTTNKLLTYPSGHATQSMLVGCVYTQCKCEDVDLREVNENYLADYVLVIYFRKNVPSYE